MKPKAFLLLALVLIPLGFVFQLPSGSQSVRAEDEESVTVTYQVQNKTFHDYTLAVKYPYGDYGFEKVGDFAWLMDDDTYDVELKVLKTNQTNIAYTISFLVESPYTALSKVYYDFKATAYGEGGINAQAIGLRLFTASSSVEYAASGEDSWKTGSASLSSSYVVDGYIHGVFGVDILDNSGEMDSVCLYIDQLAFEYENVTETVVSDVSYWSDNTVKYQIDFTPFDYGTQVTVDAPADWVFHSINPNATRSAWVFTNTVPTTYTVTANNTGFIGLLNPLYFTDFGIEVTWDDVRVWLQTSWRNCTVTIKDNYNGVNTTKINAVLETSNTSWSYEVPHESGMHIIYLDVDGGADSMPRSFQYYWDWYVPTEPDDDIGVGPLVNERFQQIQNFQFWQSIGFGVAVLVLLGFISALAVMLRRERATVLVDEATGQIFKKKRLKTKKVKAKAKPRHESFVDEIEGLLDEPEFE